MIYAKTDTTMTSLLVTLNTTREETISTHYDAAVAELKDKIKAEPLKTVFHIYAGCVSEKITAEIAHRLNNTGIKATLGRSGIFTTGYYLTVDVSLPETLVHEEKKEEKKEEEVKEEQPVVSESIAETTAESS